MSRVDLLRDGLLRPKTDVPEPARDSLQEWMEEADEQGLELPAPAAVPTPRGPCSVCGQREASSTCHQCGQGICAADQWIMFGLCRACLTEEDIQRARTRSGSRPDLGIKWIDD